MPPLVFRGFVAAALLKTTARFRMALSKNWVRDFERWSEAEDPMALLGDVASAAWVLRLWSLNQLFVQLSGLKFRNIF